jgi:High potential iron-sulfur protein
MNLTRRNVLKNLGLAAGFSAALSWRRTRSAEPPRLDVKEPAAIALGYVENVAHLDVKKYREFVPGSNCENCLQLQGSAGNNYRPCSLFPGKLVSVSGWCKAWTPEM